MRMRFKDGKQKALTLSYDDGFIHDIRFVGLMDKYGIKGTFNICSGMFLEEEIERDVMDGKLKLSESVKLYQASGHEVGAHTVHHIRPDKVDKVELMYEIFEDRKSLEKEFDAFIRGFAHPFSVYNNDIKEILKLCGYSYARGGESSYNFELPENRFCIKPTCRHRDVRLMELAEKFVNETPKSGDVYLFYVMGHSHEFDNEEKWERIEEFFKKISKKDDVWYATNIEIFDYIDAYEALKATADKKIVYNPSALDVWIEEKGKIYYIPSGETIEVC